jgi:hypothetical protein
MHWSGNFDEVQDFENQLRGLNGGTGLMDNSSYFSGSHANPLGDPTAGLSDDLDALAAYVSSLSSFDPSPYFKQSLSQEAQAGKDIFVATGCAACHSGSIFTDSPKNVLHAIGTQKSSSGKRLGKDLTGLDTPTLIDVWSSAPYLHDGSAATLQDAIKAHQGINLGDQDLNKVASYLLELNKTEEQANQGRVVLNLRSTNLEGSGQDAALSFAALSNEDGQLKGLTFGAIGGDPTGLSLSLYQDTNQNGRVDANDKQLMSTSFASETLSLEAINLSLVAAKEQHFVVQVSGSPVAASLKGWGISLALLGFPLSFLGLRRRKTLTLAICLSILLIACGGPSNVKQSFQLTLNSVEAESFKPNLQITGLPLKGIPLDELSK